MKNYATLFGILLLGMFLSMPVFAQKRPLGHEDILSWNRITEQRISGDGQTIVYKQDPWKGDPVVFIKTREGELLGEFTCGTRTAITADSRHVIFTIQPPADTIRQHKLKKTKKDQMPKDHLVIFHTETRVADTIQNILSWEIPGEWGALLAYQVREQALAKNAQKGDEDAGEEAKKEKKESDENGRMLHVLHLNTGQTLEFPFVKQYHLAREAQILVFYTSGAEDLLEAGLHTVNLETGERSTLLAADMDLKQLHVNDDASAIAFLADIRDPEERKKKASYALWLSAGQQEAVRLADNTSDGIPDGLEISANGRVMTNPAQSRVFFGLAPIPPEKDTTVLDEEKPVLDIWHWNEPDLQTVQIHNKARKMRESFQAVYHLNEKRLVCLQDEDIQGIRLVREGDADQAVAWSNLPYAVQSMWEGSPDHLDIYLVDMLTGKKEMIIQDLRAYPQVSPNGRFLYWFNPLDTTWNTRELATGQEYCIADASQIQTADELNDIPNPPGSYGSPGWLKDDEAILLYDRYTVWKADPRNAKEAVKLIETGEAEHMTFRLIDFDRQESMREGLDLDRISLLSGTNLQTREDGYYEWKPGQKKSPKPLLYGPFQLSTPVKARDAEQLLFTLEDFQTFPDLQTAGMNLKKPIRISEANPQQKEFIWGTAELVSWTSLDGRTLEGLLYKPEDFDPSRKYPMIVNFYEKSSQGLYNHRIPERHRSTIDYHYYTSNGYLVFNPDIYYKTGYPGEDAFNCVMPGITMLIDEGYVDEKAIGAQGHSWGGYQVAYLATRTQLFAAIESGAPVVNMFSAYGGIRWGSGLSRAFQYEHTQSRIGKSIWEAPLRYLENSPVFTLDKVTTPILIMHNDDDGAVPWYQGIEFFIGLRRLGKPAWLLNYNNADHWPTRLEDKHDFQIRMAQFFDHYLKGDPMPEWMLTGIPATQKGINKGY